MYVALLRGINVGTAKRIRMTELAATVTSLGFTDVHTLLNSGNVVFRATVAAARTAAARIERAVLSGLGVKSRVIVVSGDAVATALAVSPFDATRSDPSRTAIAFLAPDVDRAKLATVAAQRWGAESIEVRAAVAYLHWPTGAAESPLMKAFAKATGDATTVRNVATCHKIAALAEKLASK